jgi:hypothetical protein
MIDKLTKDSAKEAGFGLEDAPKCGWHVVHPQIQSLTPDEVAPLANGRDRTLSEIDLCDWAGDQSPPSARPEE